MLFVNHFRVFDFPYKKELYLLATVAVFGFVGISLYSYNADDISWFYYSSAPQQVQNIGGFLGAHLAAFLIYLFGAAAYILVPFSCFAGLWLVTREQGQRDWERVIALIGILFLGTIFFAVHKINFFHTTIPGGYLGYSGLLFFNQFFDQVGTRLLLYIGIYASFVLLFRFTFIGFARSMILVVSKIRQFFVRHCIIQRGRILLQLCMRSVILGVCYGWKFLDGSIFEKKESLDRSVTNSMLDAEKPLNNGPALTYEAYTPQVAPSSEELVYSEQILETDQQDNKNNSVNLASSYGLPNLDIFIGVDEKKEDVEFRRELEERAHILEEKLERFGVYGSVISIKSGPVVTLFEYQPEIDTKVSKILSLEDDLALTLQAMSIRILAPIPGRSVVGFEVSNKKRKEVLLASVIQSQEYIQFDGLLPLILGQDTVGNNVVVDLAKMPHLLIAGSTGSGKSVALNSMLISLLCKCTPDELRLVLIDPKRLEFASYADISHLLFPIVTDPRQSVPVLKWVVKQMELRYEKMAQYGVRNVFEYNKIALQQGQEKFPFIVIVIDELSDLMMTVGREIEDLITRITQMARAAGIHMIIATQRPSVDVITGLIKVNFPSRISCRVTSKVDSRTILDCSGADKLLGRGDMLFLDSTASLLKRVHGSYVSDDEIHRVTSHIRDQRLVEYLDITQELAVDETELSVEDEDLYKQVVAYLDDIEEISISLLQRKFRIGYNRSARIIEKLEMHGLIMPADGGKTRRVIR